MLGIPARTRLALVTDGRHHSTLSGDSGNRAATFIVKSKPPRMTRGNDMSKWTINRFRKAEAEYVQVRDRWVALTQQERNEVGADKFGLNEAKRRALMNANAVIAEFAGRHTIEETARVYLILGKDGWEIDSASMVEMSLTGQEYGPTNGECEHERGLDAECIAVRDAAALIDLPTGHELAALMNVRRYDLPVPD
jgi:hypothetical protein